MTDEEKLRDLVLAPYILKATALIGVRRKVGGNQFRHAMATLAILMDYKLFSDPVLLKASVIHDLIEDVPRTNVEELKRIDSDATKVIDLVLEVTRKLGETKVHYLKRIVKSGSYNAKLLKVADRISNLTDLHLGIFSPDKFQRYINETEKYVLPIAEEVSPNMYKELGDLIKLRREVIYPAITD